LYQANTNWSTNFDTAALGDQDGDGIPTWQEYIAGTDPQNAASAFALSISASNGQQVVSFPTVMTSPQYRLQRYYAIQRCTSLATQTWQGIDGATNIAGLGQTVVLTNALFAPNAFFRGQVWLGP
jgi:hypothetical protein